MELKQALEQLETLQKKLYAYQCASSSLYLDSVTVAPKDTAQGRGVALGILAGEEHKLFADPEVGKLLDFLEERSGELTFPQRRQVQVSHAQHDSGEGAAADFRVGEGFPVVEVFF